MPKIALHSVVFPAPDAPAKTNFQRLVNIGTFYGRPGEGNPKGLNPLRFPSPDPSLPEP